MWLTLMDFLCGRAVKGATSLLLRWLKTGFPSLTADPCRGDVPLFFQMATWPDGKWDTNPTRCAPADISPWLMVQKESERGLF